MTTHNNHPVAIASRLRAPTTRRLELPNGDWLLVKEHLTAGDQRRLLRGSAKRVRNLEGVEVEVVDPLQAPLAQAAAYLLDWSLVDLEGRPISIRGLDDTAMLAVLDMLPPEDCEEIVVAIDVHDTEMRALRAAEKKASDGGMKSPATSPSPESSAGAMSGSPSSTPMSMVS